MTKRKHDDVLGVTGAETIIGAGVGVKGNIRSEADIVIDGTLDGSVKTAGDLTIGVNANIKGNVEATNLTIAGALHGNIHAAGEVTIRETGRVEGDIRAGGLAINSGGVFIGTSSLEQAGQLPLPEDDDPRPRRGNP